MHFAAESFLQNRPTGVVLLIPLLTKIKFGCQLKRASRSGRLLSGIAHANDEG